MTFKPNQPNPEGEQNPKPQTRYTGYATTSQNGPVFEIPVQAVTDLENTIGRLYSDAATPSAASKGTSAAPTPAESGAPIKAISAANARKTTPVARIPAWANRQRFSSPQSRSPSTTPSRMTRRLPTGARCFWYR
jgi:hypothetical protein